MIEASNEKGRLLTDKVNFSKQLEGELKRKMVTEATSQLQAQLNESRAQEAETPILTDDKAMCPFCNFYYTDALSSSAPHILLCWRLVCHSCIDGMAQGEVVQCNSCGCNTEMGPTGASGLPLNVFILKANK